MIFFRLKNDIFPFEKLTFFRLKILMARTAFWLHERPIKIDYFIPICKMRAVLKCDQKTSKRASKPIPIPSPVESWMLETDGGRVMWTRNPKNNSITVSMFHPSGARAEM
jgi:hypothetical protein